MSEMRRREFITLIGGATILERNSPTGCGASAS
jgi:hypothetical protein